MAEENTLTPEKVKPPIGRPRLEFDLRQVAELGKIQSTQPELAAVLGCGLSTVKDRLAKDDAFSTAYRRGLETGKSSLRRLQWKSALAGNVVMQIWLGKQYLDQRDQQAVEVTRTSASDQWAELARTKEGRQLLAELSPYLARGMRVLARGETEPAEVIEGEARELPALPKPGAEEKG